MGLITFDRERGGLVPQDPRSLYRIGDYREEIANQPYIFMTNRPAQSVLGRPDETPRVRATLAAIDTAEGVARALTGGGAGLLSTGIIIGFPRFHQGRFIPDDSYASFADSDTYVHGESGNQSGGMLVSPWLNSLETGRVPCPDIGEIHLVGGKVLQRIVPGNSEDGPTISIPSEVPWVKPYWDSENQRWVTQLMGMFEGLGRVLITTIAGRISNSLKFGYQSPLLNPAELAQATLNQVALGNAGNLPREV